jgi:hypothetical protein
MQVVNNIGPLRLFGIPISTEIADLLDFVDLQIDSEFVVETLQEVIKLTNDLPNEVGSFLFKEISTEFDYLLSKYTADRAKPLDKTDTTRLKLKANFWLSEIEYDMKLTENKSNILPSSQKWDSGEKTNKF